MTARILICLILVMFSSSSHATKFFPDNVTCKNHGAEAGLSGKNMEEFLEVCRAGAQSICKEFGEKRNYTDGTLSAFVDECTKDEVGL